MSDVETTLKALKSKFAEISPTWATKSWNSLEAPVDEKIAAMEAAAGFELHPELRQFFATCDFRMMTDGNYSYEGFAQMLDNWEMMNGLVEDGTFDAKWDERVEENGDRLQPTYWNRGWVPFVVDGCGNLICVDHNPGPNGVHGQVIMMECQDGQGPYITEFATLSAYLDDLVGLLENGKYTADDAEGFIEIDRWS